MMIIIVSFTLVTSDFILDNKDGQKFVKIMLKWS